VEVGDARSLFQSPAHPYTQALLSAVPTLDPDAPTHRISFDGDGFDPRVPLRPLGGEHWAAV
jgi:oligopeptide/dipeptide ABC transporter ATP-binding protein